MREKIFGAVCLLISIEIGLVACTHNGGSSDNVTTSYPSSDHELTIATNQATLVRDDIAVLNGTMSYSAINALSKVYFAYGTDKDNLSQSTVNESLTPRFSFSQTVIGLSPDTTYYFQAVADGPSAIRGQILSFKTAVFSNDYYVGFLNDNGTIRFVDKDNDDLILDNSAVYNFNYGENISSAIVSPLNASFEINNDLDKLPDNWIIDKDYIEQSDEYASDGIMSLKISATTVDNSHRRVYSSLILVSANARYEVDADSFLSEFDSGYPRVLIAYYRTLDGSGETYFSSPVLIPTTLKIWNKSVLDWTPPTGAKSFRVLIYCPENDIETLYIDNIVVKEIGMKVESNGIVTSSILYGDEVTIISSIDDSNPSVTVENRYDLDGNSPNVKYTATVSYKKPVTVGEERFDFVVPEKSAVVMTRDFKLTKYDVSKEYYSDSFIPKVVKFGNGLSFLDDDTMQSMYLGSLDMNNSIVSFFSDNYLNHPHNDVLKNGNGQAIDTSAQKRFVGDTYSASVIFWINPGVMPKTIVKTLQPNGYDATVIFSNHPDQETLSAVKAIAYGTEDVTSPIYGTRGMVSRGIGWTKGVFVAGQTGADLQNADYKALTHELYLDGVEIVPHSITTSTDSRAVVKSGLQELLQYKAETWIDHGRSGGIMNLEDLSSQGSLKGNDNYILDILDDYNYKFAWAYNDLPLLDFNPNMLYPERTNQITPFLFYNSNIDDNTLDDKKIYIFSTLSTVRTADLVFTVDNINNLISQRGISIAHDYLGYPLNQNHTWFINPVSQKIEITPEFDAELEHMEQMREAGLLWTPTIKTFGSYLLSLKNIEIVTNADGSYTLTNQNNESISGVTLLAESRIKSATLNGTSVFTFGGTFGSNEIVLPEIAPGESWILTVNLE